MENALIFNHQTFSFSSEWILPCTDNYGAFLLCFCWVDNYLSPLYRADFSTDSFFWVPNEPFQFVTPFIIHSDSRTVTFL